MCWHAGTPSLQTSSGRAKPGVDHRIIDEYERLSKSVDINKRLLKILETTYSIKDTRAGMGENIMRAIKSMATSIKLQDERLNQIRSQFSDVFEAR